MKVLIVDDNNEFAFIIQKILEAEGYETRSASDAQDGYLSYLFFRPDLVITDLQMPGDNGFELMRHIRAHNPWIKTIYMSGDMSRFAALLEEEKMKYRVSLLEKPFSYGDLARLLSEFKKMRSHFQD
jgi:CheY-like chemotaxis protein